MSTYVGTLDKQMHDLMAQDTVDASVAPLVNSLRATAAVTHALFQIGTTMKQYYMRSQAQVAAAEVSAVLKDMAKQATLAAVLRSFPGSLKHRQAVRHR